MAKIVNLGFNGNLGAFDFFSMYGKNYVRVHAEQKDPKTPDQLAHRFAVKKTGQIAHCIYQGVLKPYTFPKPKSSNLAIFNRMMQINGLIISNNTWNPENLKIFEGSLDNMGISSAVLTGNTVNVAFSTEKGERDDVAIAVVYDDTTDMVSYAVGTRNAGALDVRISPMASKNANTLHAYLAFSRLPADKVRNNPASKISGFQGLVSTTAYKKVE